MDPLPPANPARHCQAAAARTGDGHTPSAASVTRGERMMPVAFTDPLWLWLLVPGALLIVGGWAAASRTLSGGRRIASLVIRLVLAFCLIASLAGARLALPSDRLSVVFLIDASASMVDATREELLDFARDSVRLM